MEVMRDQTTPGPARLSASNCALVVPVALVIAMGTGSFCASEVIRARDATHIVVHEPPEQLSRPAGSTGLSDEIATIKISLRMTTSEIANALGVSRQALYNWKAGSAIKPENAARFRNLVGAATAILGSGQSLSPLALKRRLPGGKTIAESIAAGGNGTAAALSLLELLRNEAEQRAALTTRFKGRNAPPTSMVEAASVAED